jgi:hypothetical protein
LEIIKCGITDEGFKPLRRLSPGLRSLSLVYNPLTDAVLDDLEKFTKVEAFGIGGDSARVSWARVAQLQFLKSATYLDLGRTGITDADLVYFKDLPTIQKLWLGHNPITDKSLITVGTMKGVTYLALTGNQQITDAGLPQLYSQKNLQEIDLKGTGVTADGVKKVAAALPNCKIESESNQTTVNSGRSDNGSAGTRPTLNRSSAKNPRDVGSSKTTLDQPSSRRTHFSQSIRHFATIDGGARSKFCPTPSVISSW